MNLTRLLLTILLAPLLLLGQEHQHRGKFWIGFSGRLNGQVREVLLPNPAITPGDYESVPLSQLCVKGFAGRRRAAQYSQIKGGWKRIRRLAFRQYHVTDGTGPCKSEGCEGDHLVPETLAGKTTLQNIWPQPFGDHPGAHEKDVLEVWAGREVCGRRMTLHDAQVKIASDWFSFYLEMERTVKH